MIAKENIVLRRKEQRTQIYSVCQDSNQLEVSEGRVRCEIPHYNVINSGQELGPAVTRGTGIL